MCQALSKCWELKALTKISTLIKLTFQSFLIRMKCKIYELNRGSSQAVSAATPRFLPPKDLHTKVKRNILADLDTVNIFLLNFQTTFYNIPNNLLPLYELLGVLYLVWGTTICVCWPGVMHSLYTVPVLPPAHPHPRKKNTCWNPSSNNPGFNKGNISYFRSISWSSHFFLKNKRSGIIYFRNETEVQF